MTTQSPTGSPDANPAPTPNPPASNVVELRKLLEQRFPQLRQGLAPRVKRERFPTGVANLDRLLGGGLPRGAFTELVARGYGTGSVAVLLELLRSVAATRQ